jgi:hypothetical protein
MIAKEYLSYHELKKISTVKPSLYSQFHTEHLRPSWTVRARLVNFRGLYLYLGRRMSMATVSTFDFCRRRSAFCARDAVTWEPVALLCPARRLCLARALLLPRRGAPAPSAAAAATCREPMGTLLSIASLQLGD